MRFEHPEWLALLLLCIPMAWALLRWCTPMSRVRRWSAVITRVVLIGLIAGAMAGASAVRRSDKLAVIAVVDVSGSVQRFFNVTDERGRRASMTELVQGFMRDATKDRGPEDLLGMVLFDGSAVAVAVASRSGLPEAPLDVTYAEGSDIAQALRLGAAMIPPDAAGRLVLFSDGNETAGDALTAAREVVGGRAVSRRTDEGKRAGLPIDVVPLTYRVSDEVVMESVDTPPQAPAGAVVNVRVVLDAASEATGTLQLMREREVVDINGAAEGTGLRLTLKPGRHVELIPVQLGEGRIHRFDAVWEPDLTNVNAGGERGPVGDSVASNNRAQSFTLTPGKGSVLLVDGVGDARPDSEGRTLANVLTDAGLSVTVVPTEGIPDDLISLQEHDLVILGNVPADAMARQMHGALASYVTELGGGLVMLGGKQSFGAGAWKGTLLEPILPVRLDLPEKLIIPAAAVVIILDNSGSMQRPVMGSMRSQQEIANEGAALAVQSMDRTDLVGVISFNSVYNVEIPLAKNTDSKGNAAIIRSIMADGGTNLPPAVAAAHEMLNKVTADVKHIIVLSDGGSQDRERLPGMCKELREDGIKLSTIAIGDQADLKTMSEMANQGGGQYYRVIDPDTLPRIFVKAVRVVRSPLVREGAFTPVVLATGSPMLQGMPASVPPLFGVNLTQAKVDPTVNNAMAHPNGEPLLAHWNAGLGRVTAFTSDASTWAREWINWPGYREFWTQVARNTARPAADRFQELTTEIVGDELRVRLDATSDNGRPLDLLDVPGSVYLPSGDRVPVRLSQTGPGVYEATAPAPLSGNYVVTLTPRAGTRPLTPVIGGVSRATGVEFRRLQSSARLMQQIADETGGRLLDLHAGGTSKLFERAGLEPSEARLPLWRPILLWALVVMLLDVGTRRVAWDRWLSREYGRSIKRETKEAVRDRGVQSASLTQQLRGHAQKVETATIEKAREVPAPAALSEDDARRIVREQAERRKAARQQAAAERAAKRDAASAADDVKPVAPPPSSTPSAPPISPTPAPPPSTADEPAGGLFAAKARARKRMENQDGK